MLKFAKWLNEYEAGIPGGATQTGANTEQPTTPAQLIPPQVNSQTGFPDTLADKLKALPTKKLVDIFNRTSQVYQKSNPNQATLLKTIQDAMSQTQPAQAIPTKNYVPATQMPRYFPTTNS